MPVADPRQVPTGIFLYTLHPARLAMLAEGPTAEEQALAARHWAYSQELLARGVLVFGGRTLNRDADSMAVVAVRAPSAAAARALVDADPAVAGGLFTAQVFPFQPMLMGAWPPEAATAAPTADPVAAEVAADLTAFDGVLRGPADPEVVALEARLRAAQLDADVRALDALLSDDLLFTGPDGQLGTKAQDLAAHGSGAGRVREHAPEELRVRRVGADAAVCALRTRLAVDVAGATVRGTYRYTRVWAREGGAWRVAGGHVGAAPA